MIVYYHPVDKSIKGMSYRVLPENNFPFFETDDPIAEKIFLGTEKSIRFHVIINGSSGHIKLKDGSLPADQTIKQRVIQIPKGSDIAQLSIFQNTNEKTITVNISAASYKWWSTDSEYSLKKVQLIACRFNDPYTPSWARVLELKDLESLTTEFNYTGTDNITFYTTKLFDSYRHEIKSS